MSYFLHPAPRLHRWGAALVAMMVHITVLAQSSAPVTPAVSAPLELSRPGWASLQSLSGADTAWVMVATALVCS
jgi:hypothetical protein